MRRGGETEGKKKKKEEGTHRQGTETLLADAQTSRISLFLFALGTLRENSRVGDVVDAVRIQRHTVQLKVRVAGGKNRKQKESIREGARERGAGCGRAGQGC
jgi:hypothetical protein